ncbi:MAG: hypothetical protein IJC26_07840, partial [Clostridia bacterium]|nr:hypothetical protein [Clostridia bacterium]
MSVHRGKNAVCDGIISPEEYGNGITQKNESGLYSMNREQTELGVVPSDFWQESYVSLCGDFVYCAIRLVSGNLPLNPIATEVGACYCVTFSLGMSPGEHPALRSSVFSNTYYISSTDFSCVGFTGKRIARSIREISISSKPLSTFVESYVNNGIVTPDGNKWNATHYCENIAFSLESSGSTSTMIAEARFPLEDVLLSV